MPSLHLPGRLSRAASGVWRTCRSLPRAARTAFREGLPDLVLHFGVALGDDLLATAVARELTQRGRRRIWMMSNHPALFEGNRDLTRVVPAEAWYAEYARMLRREYHPLMYSEYDPATDAGRPPVRHVIAEMCARLGLRGEITLRPYLHLDPAERDAAAWADGCIAIQSSGLAARVPMRNKEWYPERFQAVVDALRFRYRFVQVGLAGDPPLAGAEDLRGRSTPRETAAVLARARLFVGLESFLMHLARAVECPSVIVFGGRVAPWQLGYTCNVNLYSAVACAPCWARNTCPYGLQCMADIPAEAVVAGIEQQLARQRDHLIVDTTRI